MNSEKTVNRILEEIDKSMLLGAAFDCMTESGKEKFKSKIKKIVEDNQDDNSQN
jgi:hypothetical protein